MDRGRRNVPQSWRGTANRDEIMRGPYRISSRPQRRRCVGMRIRRPSTPCSGPSCYSRPSRHPRAPPARVTRAYSAGWPAHGYPGSGCAPEVEQTYSQAYALCQQVEDTAQLLSVLAGLAAVLCDAGGAPVGRGTRSATPYAGRAPHDRAFLLEAHVALGGRLFFSAV
jgi:hypothetical protein